MASRVDEDDQQELLNTEMTYFSEGDARGHGRHKRETHNAPGSADDCNTELLHLIYLGDVFEYTIPSFRFITVELQHAVICDITRSDAVRVGVEAQCCSRQLIQERCESLACADHGHGHHLH